MKLTQKERDAVLEVLRERMTRGFDTLRTWQALHRAMIKLEREGEQI